MLPALPKTIVLIHGLFMNPHSWDQWVRFFQAKGFDVHTPAYRYHDGAPAQRRSNIDPALGKLDFTDVIHDLSQFIDSLPEKPILIGHSMGGLAVQKLIELGKGYAGVCLDPAPPKGVVTLKWSFLKANFPTINPFKGNSTCLPSVKWFHYAFCNTLTLAETQAVYDEFVVPESRNIPRSITKAPGKINFSKPHNPLLIIGGEKDNIIPPSLNEKNAKAYTHSGSITDFKVFAGRTHYLCGQPNWEEIAEYISTWLDGLQSRAQ